MGGLTTRNRPWTGNRKRDKSIKKHILRAVKKGFPLKPSQKWWLEQYYKMEGVEG
jgi:hypothetical protein